MPFPWTDEAPGFGFTTGSPWLLLPADWGGVSASAQAGAAGSTLELYRRALALRPRDGDLAWRDGPPGSLVLQRGELTCAVNVSGEPFPLPPGELVLASDPSVQDTLGPDTAAWLRRGAA